MKLLLLVAVLVAPMLASCAHPLEQVVEDRRAERVKATYANQPITSGSGDGLGHYIAQTADNRLTLSERP